MDRQTTIAERHEILALDGRPKHHAVRIRLTAGSILQRLRDSLCAHRSGDLARVHACASPAVRICVLMGSGTPAQASRSRSRASPKRV